MKSILKRAIVVLGFMAIFIALTTGCQNIVEPLDSNELLMDSLNTRAISEVICLTDPPAGLGPIMRYYFKDNSIIGWQGPFTHNLGLLVLPCPEDYYWSGWSQSAAHDTGYIEFGPALPPIPFCCPGDYRVVYERGRDRIVSGNAKN